MAPLIEVSEKVLKDLDQLKIPYNLKKEEKSELQAKTQKSDKEEFIYVPSINIYVAKKRTHFNKTWKYCWTKLQKENYKMLKINEFREFLKYLISAPNNQEYKNIFNEITEVRTPWRAEWLDANFKVKNKGLLKKDELYILTENKSKEEKLEDCLMEDKTPGINLEDWINGKNITSQGLPNKNIQSGNLYYWKPGSDNNPVARFSAGVDGAVLNCGRGLFSTGSALGVRRCKAGLAGETK